MSGYILGEQMNKEHILYIIAGREYNCSFSCGKDGVAPGLQTIATLPSLACCCRVALSFYSTKLHRVRHSKKKYLRLGTVVSEKDISPFLSSPCFSSISLSPEFQSAGVLWLVVGFVCDQRFWVVLA